MVVFVRSESENGEIPTGEGPEPPGPVASQEFLELEKLFLEEQQRTLPE